MYVRSHAATKSATLGCCSSCCSWII
ncbi:MULTISPECIES: hypothetical protein [unclassified Paenibacillus]